MRYLTKRCIFLIAIFLILIFGGVTSGQAATLFSDNFNRPDGLITNEYAFWSPTDPAAVISPDWQLDSGSFFIKGNQGWSGIPDDCSSGASSPNAKSTNCTDSAIFRLNTKRFDFNNVKVAFSLFSNGLTSTTSTPPVAWDGVHIFLRYQSEFQLYYASINRREQTAVLKKKCPGGTDNGGTYYELTSYVPHSWSPGVWQHIYATVQTNPDSTVTIALYDDSGLVVQGIDNNIGKCAPITNPGAVGIRGDNNNFLVDDFTVTDLASPTTPSLTLTKSASPTTATSGSTVTFTIQYLNTSSASATNAVITDVIPSGSTLVPGSISNGGTLSGSTITWNLGTVAGSGSGSVNFKVIAN